MSGALGQGRGDEDGGRRELVESWIESGESAAAFGERVGVSRWSLYKWRRDLRLAESSTDVGLTPVRVVSQAGARRYAGASDVRDTAHFAMVRSTSDLGSGIEIRLRGERGIRLARDFDSVALSEVIRVLEGLPC